MPFAPISTFTCICVHLVGQSLMVYPPQLEIPILTQPGSGLTPWGQPNCCIPAPSLS